VTGSEGAPHHPPFLLEAVESGLDHRNGQVQLAGGVLDPERGMGAGEPPHHVAEGVGDRVEQSLGDAGRGLDPQAVPQPGGVLDRRPPCLAAQVHRDGPTFGDQGLQYGPGIDFVASVGHAPGGERAELAEQVGNGVLGTRRPLGDQPLQLEFDGGDDVRREQFPQLALAEEFGAAGRGRG
jgi:hypothetical protein